MDLNLIFGFGNGVGGYNPLAWLFFYLRMLGYMGY